MCEKRPVGDGPPAFLRAARAGGLIRKRRTRIRETVARHITTNCNTSRHLTRSSLHHKLWQHGSIHGIGTQGESFLCIRENAVRQPIVSQAVYRDRLCILDSTGVGI